MNFKTQKKISVVIPCYNEEANILDLYHRLIEVLGKLTPHYEIIFVDNKSIDSSRILLRDLAKKDPHLMVLFFSRNFGNSQYGYSAGTEHATGDAVVWMESDLQDPPEVIATFVDKWLEGYTIVYGVREIYMGAAYMRFLRRLFYKIFRGISYLAIPLDAGDFSLLDRRAVDVLKMMPERSRFVRGMRAWVGFESVGVSYKRADRHGGVTSNSSLRRNFWWAKKMFLSFSTVPFELVTRIAVWSFFGVPIFTFLIVLLYIYERVSFGFAALLVVAAWLFACIILVLAILSEALAIIFEEVKQRPRYVIEEIINPRS